MLAETEDVEADLLGELDLLEQVPDPLGRGEHPRGLRIRIQLRECEHADLHQAATAAAGSGRTATAATRAISTSASCPRTWSSASRPAWSNRTGACPTARSRSTTRAPIVASTLRSSACDQTAPKAPELAPTTATGLFRRTFVA